MGFASPLQALSIQSEACIWHKNKKENLEPIFQLMKPCCVPRCCCHSCKCSGSVRQKYQDKKRHTMQYLSLDALNPVC